MQAGGHPWMASPTVGRFVEQPPAPPPRSRGPARCAAPSAPAVLGARCQTTPAQAREMRPVSCATADPALHCTALAPRVPLHTQGGEYGTGTPTGRRCGAAPDSCIPSTVPPCRQRLLRQPGQAGQGGCRWCAALAGGTLRAQVGAAPEAAAAAARRRTGASDCEEGSRQLGKCGLG